jgi:lysine-specific demethylase 8/hypoxia-inducible factor 1-alpha inhibitor (HIF hydroxylase)
VIERVPFASLSRARFAREFEAPGRPVILTGVLEGQPPVELSWLVERIGDEVFATRCYGSERFDRPKIEWRDYAEMRPLSVREYASMLETGAAARERVYMAQAPAGHTAAGPALQVGLETFSRMTGMERAAGLNLWLGPAGHTEPLHYDSHDGTLLQLAGRKRVVLFSPLHSDDLYPFPFLGDGLAPWISQVYIEQPDFTRYPGLARALAAAIELTLEPGELLFIPTNWWHEVSVLDGEYALSVNQFWKVRQLRRAMPDLRHAIIYLSARVPPPLVMQLLRGANWLAKRASTS